MHAHDKLPQSDIHSLSPAPLSAQRQPGQRLLAFSNNVRKERQRGKEREKRGNKRWDGARLLLCCDRIPFSRPLAPHNNHWGGGAEWQKGESARCTIDRDKSSASSVLACG